MRCEEPALNEQDTIRQDQHSDPADNTNRDNPHSPITNKTSHRSNLYQ